MRKPSKGTVIMVIAAPVIGCLLLWYVVFPMIENQSDLHDLLTWKSSKEMNYSEDGYEPGSDESASGGFDDIQSATPATGSRGSSSGHSATRRYEAGNGSAYNATTNNESQAAVNQSAPVANNNNANSSGGNGSAIDENRAVAKSDAERIANIVSAAQQVKRSGDQVREMKKGKSDQSKTSGGGGPLLLLPPDDPDPVDVPLDGGLSVLVTVALGYGIRRTGVLGRRKMNKERSAA